MTTAALASLILVGFAVGLLLQFSAVYGGVESEHNPRAYLVAGLIGTVGALLCIPLLILFDYGRTGTFGYDVLRLISLRLSFVMAFIAVFYAKLFEYGDKRLRWRLLASLLVGVVALVSIVAAVRFA